MKQKFAIGITINGTEVRAAFLSLIRNKAVIKALESTKLPAPLEHSKTRQKQIHESVGDLENAFDISLTEVEPDDDHPETGENGSKDQNVSVIYALLDKFQNIKANLAINAPLLTVKYDYIEKQALEKDKDFKRRIKDKINIWGDDNNEIRRTNYLEISDGRYLQVDYEYHPAVIDLMEEVNQFRSGNLNLALMDTNEIALVDLVREIYKFEKEEVSAIIYIEEDFSRVIFLKGSEIYHITPIVHKGSTSPDVLDVIYSRIIFAQDQHFIPELNKILVAGHSSRLKAKYFFRQKFPYAITGYLNSKKIRSDLRFKDRGLLFSRYAVPIALAWKALQKNTYTNKANNLLPEYIVEKQRMPKLAVHGYFLLAMLALTGFVFTLFISKENAEIAKISKSIAVMQHQIDSNEALTTRVQTFDKKIAELKNKMEVVSSFKENYDDMVLFLEKLNRNLQQIGGIWITDLNKSGERVQLSGLATRRQSIPLLASALGGASLKKVTRASIGDEDVFAFQIEQTLNKDESNKNLSIFSALGDSKE